MRLKQLAQEGATSYQVPGWDGSKWAPQNLFNGLTLNALTTVGASGAPQSLVGAAVGHVPTWTGSAWTSQAGGGGAAITIYANAVAARLGNPSNGDLCYIVDTQTLYEAVAMGPGFDDGRVFVNTVNSLPQQWFAIAGQWAHTGLYRGEIQYLGTTQTVRLGYGALGYSPTEKYFIEHTVAIGYLAGTAITSGGDRNVLIGSGALTASTGGEDVVAIGYLALNALSSSYNRNTYVGSYAGSSLTQGSQNTAVGYGVHYNGGTSQNCTLMGYYAGRYLNTSNLTIAIGHEAGMGAVAGSTGPGNIAIGNHTLRYFTSAEYNICIGQDAGEYFTTADNNVAIGFEALGSTSNTTSRGIVAIGYRAGYDINGWKNVAIGYDSMAQSTSGAENTSVGNVSGASVTGDYNVCIGSGADVVGASSSQCIAIGRNATVGTNVSNKIQLGIGSNGLGNNTMQVGDTSTQIDCYSKSWQAYSDARIKKDVWPLTATQGLDFILNLRPVSFYWKSAENGVQKRQQLGLIAQEVKSVAQALDLAPLGLYTDNDEAGWSLNYDQLIAPVIKSIQQLNARLEAVEKRLELLGV